MTEKRDILVKKFINKLVTLKEKPFKNIEINVKDVLKTAYELGVAKIEFKDDERRTIGSLIKDVIKPIDDCIFNIGYSFEHNYAPLNLVLRSGLQFMLDNFKTFPTSQNETLEETFKYLNETESIDTLDEALKGWKNSDTPLSEDDLIFKSKEIARPNDVPNSHTWWY
jgi:hypothetical protein